ncbi:MAG: insulinase family protein [Lentisphaerae bacterium]|nr:insulinase family protein [Lentisphaerota bacterium]MCP4100156.1 insulinase family protein [Lentisphaerota bacterium]
MCRKNLKATKRSLPLTDLNLSSFNTDHFSRISSFTLDNGLRIFVNRKTDAPVVSLQSWVETGSVHEGKYLGCGLSHFLEHMLFQGCEGYPEQEGADTVNRLGGDVNAYTSFGSTVYHLELPSEHAAVGLNILAKMVSAPLFPEEKFVSEKQVILRERDLGLDRPERMLGEELWKTVFLKHPIRHPIIGYHDKIESVTRDLMNDYYLQRYSPERVFFVISGDIEPEFAREQLGKLLDGWGHGNIHEPVLTTEPWQIAMRKRECHFEDPLARIAIAGRIPPVTHRDIPALDLISGILGQSKSARLVRSLRNEKELALSVGTFNFTPNFEGVSTIMAAAVPEKLSELEASLFSEISKLRKFGVETAELQREKRQQTTEYIRALRTNQGIAEIIGQSVLSYGCPEMADRYLKILGEVSLEDIVRVASKYFSEDKLSVVKQTPPPEKVSKKSKAKTVYEHVPSKHQLKSGARCLTLHDSKLPLVDVCLAFPGGTIYETPENAGITRMLAALLGTGTLKYSESKFNDLLDANAIDLNVLGGSNSLLVRMNCMPDCLDKALDLLISMLTEPAFPQKQFEREKANAIEALKSRAQNPSAAAQDTLQKKLFGKHPYALPRTGTIDSISSLNINDLHAFMHNIMLADHTVIALGGAISEADALNACSKIDNALSWSSKDKIAMPPEPEFPASDIYEELILPREQSMVIYGVPGCNNLNEDRFVMDVLQHALNGLSSKLFKHIREDSGLAYSTGTVFSRGFQRGIVGFYAATTPQSAPEVRKMLKAECERLGQNGLDKIEFDAALAGCLFTCSGMLERSDALLYNSLLSEYYGNGFMVPFQNTETFKNLTLEKVNKVLKKYFGSTSGVFVTAGPEA